MARVNLRDAADRRDGRALRYEHRRSEILDAVVDYVVAQGRTALPLREAAAAAGISHATLLHHFGSKEALIEEALQRLRERAPHPSSDAGDLLGTIRSLWSYWSAPDGIPALALQYETFAAALRDRERHREYLLDTAHAYLEPSRAAALAAGCPESDAELFATELVATLRGLILDLSATQERDRVDGAFERLVKRVQREIAAWS